MNIWLMKSEPDEFSIDDLQKRKKEPWTGVRNYQARNFMRAAKVNDAVLFYHSNCTEPGIVGLARVSKVAFTDPTQFDPKSDYYDAKSDKVNPRWSCIEVSFVQKFKNVITLPQLRENKKLRSMLILRPGNRLSVTPVELSEYLEIKKLS
jgi:predicted RNA-binding protein with PUA-like domain